MERVKPGQAWRPRTARDENSISEATEYFQQHRLGGAGGKPLEFRTDILKVKNTAGFNIQMGKVLMIGDSLTTEIRRGSLMFSGTVPSLPTDHTKVWGVALREVPDGEFGDFQVSGVAVAIVSNHFATHTHVNPINNSTTLHSGWHGGAKIIRRETTSLSSIVCLIRLGDPFWGPINVKPLGSNIAAGGNGSATVWVGGVATADTITCFNEWGDLATINTTDESKVFFRPDQNKFVFYHDFT